VGGILLPLIFRGGSAWSLDAAIKARSGLRG